MINLPVALLMLSLTQGTTPEPSQARIVAGIKRVAAAWNKLAETQEPVIVNCDAGGFMALRLRPGSQIAFNLKKTESLINPLVGEVVITGGFQTTSSPDDGRCQPTVEAARLSRAFWGNDDLRYTMEIVYQVEGETMVLSNANVIFQNQAGKKLVKRAPGASDSWQSVLRTKL